MTKDDLKQRLTDFAIRVIRLVNSIPRSIANDAISRQIVRSGTSPSANYRAACLGKSDKDFLNKLKMVEEELDETMHWLNIISQAEMVEPTRLVELQQECNELFKIIVSSIKTLRRRLNDS